MSKLIRISAPAVIGVLLAAGPAAARAATARSADRTAAQPNERVEPGSSEQKETERVDRTLQIRAGGQLRLKNFSGRVTITGSNRGDMAVHAVRRATRERLDHVKLDIQETASGVTIEANKKDSDWREKNDNVVETEFDIEVPADVDVDIEVFSSDVGVRDVRGKQRVHTFSGDVELSGGEKSIDAETFSGNIAVKLAQGVSATIDFDSFSGSVHADIPLTYRSSGRRHMRADIGGGGTGYNFKTFSGDVRIQ